MPASQTRKHAAGGAHPSGDDDDATAAATTETATMARGGGELRNIFMEVVRFCLLEIKSVTRLYFIYTV